MTDKINALFVIENGPYYGLKNVIPWSEEENAFNCKNGAPAICHPPCKRWGRYWSGGPSVKVKKLKGDDAGCFAFSLWYVRTFGGIIEHPEGTHAYSWFGLNRPPKKGGWIKADDYGGYTCCVEQGHYGHKARKATWLYINKIKPIELIWGPSKSTMRLDMGPHSKEEALVMRNKENYVPIKRLSSFEMLATPIKFRKLLIGMVLND